MIIFYIEFFRSDCVLSIPTVQRQFSLTHTKWYRQYNVDLHREDDDFNDDAGLKSFLQISMASSYVDFTIVAKNTWVHVLKGKKIFFVIRPSKYNRKLFKKWMLHEKRTTKFFGRFDEKNKMVQYTINVNPGETIFIPAGSICACFTPENTIAATGFFYSIFNLDDQIKANSMLNILDMTVDPNFLPIHVRCFIYLPYVLDEWLKENRKMTNDALNGIRVFYNYMVEIKIDGKFLEDDLISKFCDSYNAYREFLKSKIN